MMDFFLKFQVQGIVAAEILVFEREMKDDRNSGGCVLDCRGVWWLGGGSSQF